MFDAVEPTQRRRRLGVILKKYRSSLGLTQKALSRQLGLGCYAFIAQTEGGSAHVPPVMLSAWARALELDSTDFAKVVLRYFEPVCKR